MQQYQDLKLNPFSNSSLHHMFRPIRLLSGAETCSAVTNFKKDLILNLDIVAWWTVKK
jgi:hypothetical protein